MSFRHIGIYSGTFDPVHEGHIAFGLEALRVCKLDEVLLLPEQIPRGKQQVTDISHRVALLHAATDSIVGLRVMTLPSEQCTVADTLPVLRAQCGDAELTLLIGSDIVLGSFSNWENLGILLHDVSFAVGMRHGDSKTAVIDTMEQLAAKYKTPVRYTIITTEKSNIASSHIRAKKVTSRNPAVASYIQKHGLYR